MVSFRLVLLLLISRELTLPLLLPSLCFFFFFFNDTATTEIYTLSLHDALPIWTQGPTSPKGPILHGERQAGSHQDHPIGPLGDPHVEPALGIPERAGRRARSEEHTSELQSHSDLVCRLLLEKKKKKDKPKTRTD